MYLLVDANVTAGYYLPRSLNSINARKRIEIIFDSIRTGKSDNFLYIPNFCIAEVFSVFAKHSFGKWNRHITKSGTIDTRVYKSIIKQFAEDIHNGKFLYQYELSRYHILGIDLVAPIDHYYQTSKGSSKHHIPMGTFDHLIASMGVQLAHLHGSDNVAIVTSDKRLANVLSRCKQKIPAETVKKLKLDRASELCGKPFSPDIFPKCADLINATNSDLSNIFGIWPLKTKKPKDVYRWLK